MTAPARKPAPPRAAVTLTARELAFAQREGMALRTARESGRGLAHFGLDAWGHVILSAENGDGGSNHDHVSYPISHACPVCSYDPADDAARVDGAGVPRKLPNAFTDACERCGHPPLAFPPRTPATDRGAT